jgi:anaerobic selenocysteine-containing dehydrogenase
MTATVTVDPSVSRTPLPLDADDLPTVCVLCSHNCGIRVDVQDGRITAVRADASNPISRGYICNKGFSVPAYVTHAQRVTHPLRRRPDGSFEAIAWDTAIAEIAAKLAAIRAQYSPRAIGLVGIGGQANHMDAPYGIGFLRGLGSRKWFNAFAQEKSQHALMDQWMFDSSPTTWLHTDQRHTRCLLVLGTNPKISNRGHNATEFFKELAGDPTRTVIVVDPRETETTRQASRHLRVRPGTDCYLLLALAAIIVDHGLVDERFVRERTRDFETLRVALSAVDAPTMAARCGLAVEDLVVTAADFARAESASIFWDLGVEQAPFSTLNSYLIRIILALTGNLGRPGGSVFFETFAPPVLDPSRVREPERALASGIAAIRALGNFGMFSPTLVPEEVLVDHPQRLRALIVEGSNPFLSYSDTNRWREARARLDLLLVIDPAMSETARQADYVLPPPVGYEKWEIASFPKGYPEIYVQLRPPVVPALPATLPEPEIYARLAEALDLFGPAPAPLHDLAAHALEPEGAAAFLASAQQLATEGPKGSGDPSNRVLFWTYRTLGPHLPAPSLAAVWLMCHLNAMLRTPSVVRTLGVEWEGRSPFEIAAETFRRILAHPEGVEMARTAEETNLDDHLGFADKRIRLAPAPMLAEIARAIDTPPLQDPQDPVVLASGLRTHWTANTIQRDPAWRKGRGPHCALHLSPGDAQRLGVESGQAVRVSTRRGAVTLPAAIDAHVRDGHVWFPNGFGMTYPAEHGAGGIEIIGANMNEITDSADRDPISGCPHHRYVLCRVEAGGA